MFTPRSLTPLPDRTFTVPYVFSTGDVRSDPKLEISADGKTLYILRMQQSRPTRFTEAALAVDIESKTITSRFPLEDPSQPNGYIAVMVVDGITYFSSGLSSTGSFQAWDENNVRQQQYDFTVSTFAGGACFDHQRNRAYLRDIIFYIYDYNDPGDFPSSGLTYTGFSAGDYYISHGFFWSTLNGALQLRRRLGETFTVSQDINFPLDDTRDRVNAHGVAIWGNTLYTIDGATLEPATIKAYTINP